MAELVMLLDELMVQIRYRGDTIGVLLGECAAGSDFARLVLEETGDGGDFRRGWRLAAESLLELSAEDREQVKNIGFRLGTTDAQGQISMLEMNKLILTRRANEAAAENAKKGRMYRSVGVLAGLGLAVMII